MAQSNHGPKHKAKKKKANIQKTKQRQMENNKVAQPQGEQPVNYTYHKDATTVAVPVKAWQALNMAAEKLADIAMFVSVMEQIGNEHMTDGTLMPIYKNDLEAIPGKFSPKGEQQYQIKDSFWSKGKEPLIQTFEKPSIVMADGVTVYDKSAYDEGTKVPEVEQPPLTASE